MSERSLKTAVLLTWITTWVLITSILVLVVETPDDPEEPSVFTAYVELENTYDKVILATVVCEGVEQNFSVEPGAVVVVMVEWHNMSIMTVKVLYQEEYSLYVFVETHEMADRERLRIEMEWEI
jgi:hypothetical protein